MATRSAKLLEAAEKKDAKKNHKECITLKIIDHPFNNENESRKKQINAYILYPLSSILGKDKDEVIN